MEELLIGSHVSFNKDTQLVGSTLEALSYGANTFMFYTGAPQNTSRAIINDGKTVEAYQLMEKNNIALENIIVHAPYLINLGNNENLESYAFAISFLKQEIERCTQLGMTKLVLHPGSFVRLSRETGINNVIRGLNQVLYPDQTVFICLETMAGKGSEVGISIDEIRQIIEGVSLKEKLLVCLDTCHLNDAGYDLKQFDQFLEEFEEKIGLSKIACIHINDSKNDQGMHKDRHENIGFGTLGFDTLLEIIYHDKLKDVPKILETPYVSLTNESKERLYPPYKFEIEMIKKRQINHHLIEDIRLFYK